MLDLTVIGNLGADAEVKEANGKKFFSFTVAHTQTRKDANGMKVEKTTWISCLKPIFESNMGIGPYLKKGTKVYLRGTPYARAYCTKSGELQATLNLRVDNIELLSASSNTQQTASGNTPAQQTTQQARQQQAYQQVAPSKTQQPPTMPTDDDDDLPF